MESRQSSLVSVRGAKSLTNTERKNKMNALKNQLTSSLKNKVGVSGIDMTIACDLKDALKKQYAGGFDLDCLDASDFQIGGFFNEAEAKELVVLASLDGQKDLETLAHLMMHGW